MRAEAGHDDLIYGSDHRSYCQAIWVVPLLWAPIDKQRWETRGLAGHAGAERAQDARHDGAAPRSSIRSRPCGL